MHRHNLTTLLCVILAIGTATQRICRADVPKEIRRELSQLSKELRSVSGLIRRTKTDEARSLIKRIELRAAEFGIEDDERDRTWRAFQNNLQRARDMIPVSFESEVAPILTNNCTRCHGADRSGGNLRLDIFSGLRKGGKSGPPIRPGNSTGSLLIARVTANDDQQRMPWNADRLSDAELTTLAKWIKGGATFDGDDEDAQIGQSTLEPPKPVKVDMADGTETVSFKEEVAPILVNFCLRCHQGNNPRGGFSVVTIEDVLRGGDSGDTIIPGNADDSYLWHLVGLQVPIKMPQGQALLKRSQARAIRVWINEGARFDGKDARATLRSMVPSESDLAADRLTTMSDEDFAKRRMEQARIIWKQVAPRETATYSPTDNFYVYGNVGLDRLKQIAQLAEKQVSRLQTEYDNQDTPWRGRLIIFATKDRFEYTEFNTVLRDQRTPPDTHGHIVLTPQLATAYVAFHDQTADGSESDQLLSRLIAEAWLGRDGSSLPGWLQQGFGILQSGVNAKRLRELSTRASQVVRELSSPTDVFNDASFAPTDVPSVGVVLTQFLLTQGEPKFTEFVQEVRNGAKTAEAITSVYGRPAQAVAQAFLSNL
jgi:hypothetical protein